jgi:hypothetical protein
MAALQPDPWLRDLITNNKNNIPTDWLLRPQCALWPHTRRRAVTWILGNVTYFRTSRQKEFTRQAFIDAMRKSKSALYKEKKRQIYVANYLGVIDEQ